MEESIIFSGFDLIEINYKNAWWKGSQAAHGVALSVVFYFDLFNEDDNPLKKKAKQISNVSPFSCSLWNKWFCCAFPRTSNWPHVWSPLHISSRQSLSCFVSLHTIERQDIALPLTRNIYLFQWGQLACVLSIGSSTGLIRICN